MHGPAVRGRRESAINSALSSGWSDDITMFFLLVANVGCAAVKKKKITQGFWLPVLSNGLHFLPMLVVFLLTLLPIHLFE